MLRLLNTNSIRLTRREIERFTLISGFCPDWVKTIDQLMAFVAWCKNHYGSDSSDGRFLRKRPACAELNPRVK